MSQIEGATRYGSLNKHALDSGCETDRDASPALFLLILFQFELKICSAGYAGRKISIINDIKLEWSGGSLDWDRMNTFRKKSICQHIYDVLGPI